MKKVLIGGGSGMVGSRLTDLLKDRGYEVWHLSRSKSSSNLVKSVRWDVRNQEVDINEIEGVDYIINLAGAGIADEAWSDERLQLIRDSRVKSNELIQKIVKGLKKKPEFFISASAVGYYGFQTTDHIFSEEDSKGNDLMADICANWESSADLTKDEGVKTAKIRIGLVLSDEGGVLPKIEEPIRWGVGAALGSGKQYMPWIHIDDLCRMFLYVLENQLEGVYNGAAPKGVNNKEFTLAVAKTIEKSVFLPNVPAFILKLFLGKRASLVLEGSRASSKKIEEKGYQFQFKELDNALSDLYFLT